MLDNLSEQPLTVIKLGGSLFDLPDLSTRLENFLSAHSFLNPILIPGGGPVADAIRRLDHVHQLGDDVSHRLGTQTLRLSAQFIATLAEAFEYVSAEYVSTGSGLAALWEERKLPVVDTTELTLHHAPLPSSWDVTSDSIAAWICSLHCESELVLLKSRRAPLPLTFQDAAQNGLVDLYFPKIAQELKTIYWCNLRDESPTLLNWRSVVPVPSNR